jgi:hypothetical protein
MIYKTIILPVVLCEIISATLKKEYVLRVCENGVLWRIFGSEREEMVRDWRRLDIDELH